MLGFWKKKSEEQEVSRSLPQTPLVVNSVAEEAPLVPQVEERSVVDDLQELLTYKPAATGVERLKQVFNKNIYHFRSLEFQSAINIGYLCFFLGIPLKWRKASEAARERFKLQHSLSIFLSQPDAIRRAHAYALYSGFKEGAIYGCKLATFTFTLTIVSLSLAAYRDRMRYSDLFVGGAAAGGLLKFYYGHKAFAVGTLLGGCMGCTLAFFTWSMLKFTDMTIDEVYKNERQKFFEDSLKHHRAEKEIRQIIDEEKVWPFTARRMYKDRQKFLEEKRQTEKN